MTAAAKEREIGKWPPEPSPGSSPGAWPRFLLCRQAARFRSLWTIEPSTSICSSNHVHLHRYFVFELKLGDFEPEYAGKLSFYLSAVNRTMRTPVEGPSIGVLLCESQSGPMVEFALENINQPIGVSTYRVIRELPAPIQDELPTVEDLQEVVNKLRTEIETLRREPSDGE